MMLSHRPLSSFNMSSHRTIWTHVRSNVIIITERIQFPKSIYLNSQTSGKEVFIRLGSSLRVVEKASIHGSLINVLPEYFVRMLACLELPSLQFVDLPIPKHHTELIDKVVQHRSNAVDASAGQPADIRASDIKDTLQAFADDPYSAYAKKRWLWNVLKVPKKKRQRVWLCGRSNRCLK